jgi:imidazolonepropionase-like amidohydrolase
MKKRAFILLFIFFSAFCSGQNSLVIKNINVIDVKAGKVNKEQTVVVAGNKIVSVSSKPVLPANATVIDGSGKFLIPGLWDMHAHTLGDKRYHWVFPLLIANGVTGVREMAADMSFDSINLIRREILMGKILGPRFGAVTQKIFDGPGTKLVEAWTVGTVEEARRLVKLYKQQRMDFIKVYDLLSREVYLAIVDESKRQKIPVAGHVPFLMTAAEVSDWGQISIEHNTGITLSCSRDEDRLRKELQELSKTSFGAVTRVPINIKAAMTYDEQKAKALFARFVRNGTWMCPTMIVNPDRNAQKPETPERLKYIPAPLQEVWRNALKRFDSSIKRFDSSAEGTRVSYQKKLEIVGLMHRTGVGLLAGTDAGGGVSYVFPGFSLHEELELFVQAGLSPFAALQTATLNPAKFLHKEKEFGTVEKGKIADLVLLEANPLENISNTKKIFAVVVNGKLLERKDLDELLTQVKNVASK